MEADDDTGSGQRTIVTLGGTSVSVCVCMCECVHVYSLGRVYSRKVKCLHKQ